jgi:aspartate/tyrosine/aromatic aminotransferase
LALPSLARVPAPPDPILGLAEAFRGDPRPGKINLSSGVFVDETGRTPVLPSVIEAERRILAKGASKMYRPIDGDAAFRAAVQAHVFGESHPLAASSRVAVSHTPGGTGALRVAADFLRQAGASATLWMSEPTWPNHTQLFGLTGFRTRIYPYTDPSGRRIDEDALLAALGEASPGDVVLLHGSCHNPTGVDPSPDLWRAIGDLIEERRLLPLVDFAYQGFGDGIREDASWMDGLIRPEVELLISTSFSKSFALYSERVGALLLVARSEQDAAAAQSNVKVAIRANYSNPPSHGGDIVATILGDRDLRGQWEAELAGMRTRIKDNRARLVEALTSRAIPGDWAPIASQRGLFALLGLSLEQAARLREERAVYVVGRGRINVAGFTTATFGPFADALAAVLAE